MKLIILLFFSILSIAVTGCYSSKYIKSNQVFSKEFQENENNSTSILIYTISESYSMKTVTYILKKGKNKLWKLEKRQYVNNSMISDSIYDNNCKTCSYNFKKILNSGLLEIPDEMNLRTECKAYKDTLIDGKIVTEIRDINTISDIDIHKIEYKFGKKRNSIAYKNPYIAKSICPESPERIILVNAITLIKNLFLKNM